MILLWAIVLISSVDRTNARCLESVHLEHGSTEIVNGSIFSIAIKDTFYKDRKCSPAIAVFLEGKNHFAPVGVQNKKTILIIN